MELLPEALVVEDPVPFSRRHAVSGRCFLVFSFSLHFGCCFLLSSSTLPSSSFPSSSSLFSLPPTIPCPLPLPLYSSLIFPISLPHGFPVRLCRLLPAVPPMYVELSPAIPSLPSPHVIVTLSLTHSLSTGAALSIAFNPIFWK